MNGHCVEESNKGCCALDKDLNSISFILALVPTSY